MLDDETGIKESFLCEVNFAVSNPILAISLHDAQNNERHTAKGTNGKH